MWICVRVTVHLCWRKGINPTGVTAFSRIQHARHATENLCSMLRLMASASCSSHQGSGPKYTHVLYLGPLPAHSCSITVLRSSAASRGGNIDQRPAELTLGPEIVPIHRAIAGKGWQWNWLRPYVGVEAMGETKYIASSVGEENGRIRNEPAPNTLVEDFLQPARPLVKQDVPM